MCVFGCSESPAVSLDLFLDLGSSLGVGRKHFVDGDIIEILGIVQILRKISTWVLA